VLDRPLSKHYDKVSVDTSDEARRCCSFAFEILFMAWPVPDSPELNIKLVLHLLSINLRIR
jgi:hypothetical protein